MILTRFYDSYSKEAWALFPELSGGFYDWLSSGLRCESLDELRRACQEVDDAGQAWLPAHFWL